MRELTNVDSPGQASQRAVVMFVFNDVTNDARVLREAATLQAAGYQVTIMARPHETTATLGEAEDVDGVRIVRVPIPSRWRRWWRLVRLPYRVWDRVGRWIGRAPRDPDQGAIGWLVIWRFAVLGWARRAAAAAPPADIYHGHDLSGAAAAVRACGDKPLIYDSHELFLEARVAAHRPGWARWPLARLERRIMRRADAVVTVNGSIARELQARYAPGRIVVVRNCPPRPTPQGGAFDDDPLRAAIGISSATPLVLYHGALVEHRGIEQTIEAILRPGLEKVHLALLGYGPEADTYRRRAQDPGLGGRVHVLAAVTPAELPVWIRSADVGSMPIQPTTLNLRLSTPNKLFECLSAGVPVVASDLPEMRRIVIDDPDGPLGAVCDPTDPDAIAASIRGILELDPDAKADLRARCLRAAYERWNWETESARLLDLYASLEGAPAAPTGARGR